MPARCPFFVPSHEAERFSSLNRTDTDALSPGGVQLNASKLPFLASKKATIARIVAAVARNERVHSLGPLLL